MNNLFLSILFIISSLSLYLSVFLVKKTEEKQNAVLWAVPNLFLCFFLISSVTGILNVFFVKANLLTVSIICIMVSSFLWYIIISGKRKQEFFFSLTDLISSLVIIGIALFFANGEFSSSLTPLYETSDPGVHYRMAMDVINSGNLGNMYFTPLLNSLAIRTLSFALKPIMYYKIFVLADVVYYVLSGLAVYSLISLKMTTVFKKVLALVLVMFYMIGYPLNNMVFGFNYLGLSISAIAIILILLDGYYKKTLDIKFTIISLSVGMASVAMCYILFAPVVFFTGFATIALCFFKKEKLFSLSHILTQLAVFLFPAILAVYYSLFKVGVVNFPALANEGYTYRDLISNFFMLILPTVLGIVKMVKSKKIRPSAFLLVFLLLQIAVTFALCIKGRYSTYYAYKAYYLLWLVCFYISGEYIETVEREDMYIPVCYLSCICLIFGISETKIETRLNTKNMLLCPRIATQDLFDIYHFNTARIFDGTQKESIKAWNEKIELYSFVLENLNPKNDVYVVDSFDNVYWYEALCNQRFEVYSWNDPNVFDDFYKNTKYAVINPESEEYKGNSAYYDDYSKILFKNDAGYVVQK